jgi:hypothetical protein
LGHEIPCLATTGEVEVRVVVGEVGVAGEA